MKYKVIIPLNPVQPLEAHEISAALILAEYFKHDAYVIPTGNGKTADFLIAGIEWEVKSPTGAGQQNVQRILRRALRQSSYVAIDVRRSRIPQYRIKGQLKFAAGIVRGIRGLLLITKDGEVIDIKNDL